MAWLWLRRAAGACLLALLGAAPVGARLYSVEDLLSVEGFGQVAVAPGGRWLLFERRIALGQATLVDQRAQNEIANRLYRVDLAQPAAATPLIPLEATAGVTLLGFSPDGSQAAVGRFDGESWRLGVVAIASGVVRWFDIAPDYYPFRPTLGWVDEDHLLVIAQPLGRLPWSLGAKRAEEADFAEAWRSRSRGSSATVTAIGSGRFLDVTPLPPATALVLLDVPSGRQTVLTRGNLQDLTIAPGARTAAVTSEDEAIRITDPALIGEGMALRRRRLHIVDLTSGRTWGPCPSCDVPFKPAVWSRSGRRLLFYSRETAVGWQHGRLFVADVRRFRLHRLAATGIAPTVAVQRGSYDAIGLGWSGEHPLLFAHATGAQRSDWYDLAGVRPMALTAQVANPVARLSMAASGAAMLGDQAWLLSPGGATRIGADAAAFGQTTLPASSPESAGRTLLALRHGWARILTGAASRSPSDIALGSAATRAVTASVEQAAVIGLDQDASGSAALVVYRAGAPPVAVARINAFLSAVDHAAPRRIDYTSPTGEMLAGWLYLPSAAADGRRPPLVVLPYASRVYGAAAPTAGEPGQRDPTMNVSVLRGHGYAVLLPSLPVPPVAPDHPFDLAGPVLAAVDAVIAKGLVDPARLALWGHSFGGYTTAMIVSETNRFQAAIASSGPYDLASFIGAFGPGMRFDPTYQTILQWAGYAETGPPHLGATPWSDPARYVANSPIYRAGKIETPMLILASDRDFVALGQGEQLFSALYRQGKDAVLLSYWGEEHGLASPANIRDCYRRVFAWLDDHLDKAGDAALTESLASAPAGSRSGRSRLSPIAP